MSVQRQSIDDCPHDFKALAERELPRLMELLLGRIQRPVALEGLNGKGVGPSVLLARMRNAWPELAPGDFAGCYALLSSRGEAFYVGISRKVAGRIIQHVKGKTHYDASLAFLMAKGDYDPGGQRTDAMNDPKFIKVFEKKQACLLQGHVGAVCIDNALVRYVFEAYAAIRLNTYKWNTFETH